MKMLDIINELRVKNVTPKLEKDQLKLVGDTDKLSNEFIEIIKSHKTALIDFLKASLKRPAYESIPEIAKQTYYPLSGAQKRIWILSQFKDASPAYNIIASFYLKGNINQSNLNKAFKSVINRHESLRTVFREVKGEPHQFILDKIDFEIETDDFTQLPALNKKLEAVVIVFTNHSFELEKGPLLKVKLIKISDGEYALIIGMHHIISDGWSVAVLMQEMMSSYECYCKGQVHEILPLTVQYKDYAYWLQQKLGSENAVDHKKYWIKRFAEPIEPLQIPADYARPEMKSFSGAVYRFYFDAGQYKRISDFCKLSNASLFHFLHSVLAILLYKYAGHRKIVIGTPVSGRNHFDLENQVGLYVNTLALKTTINPDQSFRDYLKATTADSLKDFEHQDYPFDQVVEALNLERDTSRNPLFDVMIVLQNTAFGDGHMDINKSAGVELSFLNKYLYKDSKHTQKNAASKFDLTFNFFTEPGNCLLEVEYCVDLFRHERIEMLVEMFGHVIAQVLDYPDKKISAIELLNEAAKNLILHAYNSPIATVPEQSIQELLKTSFLKNNKKTALIVGSNKFTYAALDHYADQLAFYLRSKLKTRKSAYIALLMDRSEWTPISILGILKAGAAYVPIDIHYPKTRIDFIIDDVAPVLILVDKAGAGLIPDHYTGQVIDLEKEQDRILSQKKININKTDLREKTAYVIYTSGSTGIPKGVEICHRNTIAFLKWAAVEFKNTSFKVLYAATSYCFDLSVFEFFFPLLTGKTIRLLDSALAITDYLTNDKSVMLNTVPSVVRAMLDNAVDLSNVTALNMAGEPVPKKFKKQLPYKTMEIRNLYGPSEDTTYSTNYLFKDDGYDIVPIGKPIGYTHLYILDEHLHLLPHGVDGEIYLSGQGIAKGYYKRAALTKEKFIPNPFVEGERMYKTGDIGRWLPDGQVAFVGRIDEQVKVRGYRIELGEIQFLLEAKNGITQAVMPFFASSKN